jgi:hypothetical protein
MNKTVFDLVGNLDTLLAVTVGAMLATLGALFAEMIEDRMNRKRRGRDAARFFGEILTTMGRTIDMAIASQKIGDPWGPVTQRMFRMAQREAGVYERNRERLFDIDDMNLRARIHAHFLTEYFPIEAIVDNSDTIMEISQRLEDDTSFDDARHERELRRLGEQRELRQRAVELLMHEREKTRGICNDLERIAKVSFASIAATAPAPAVTLVSWPHGPVGPTERAG